MIRVALAKGAFTGFFGGLVPGQIEEDAAGGAVAFAIVTFEAAFLLDGEGFVNDALGEVQPTKADDAPYEQDGLGLGFTEQVSEALDGLLLFG